MIDTHEDRIDRLEQRFDQIDGVVHALRIVALLLGIVVSLLTLFKVVLSP